MAKRVLITGGASGLGLALATRYLQAGHRVLITDINRARAEEAEFTLRPLGEVHVQQADIRNQDDWQRLHDWCAEHWGGLDVLINNAGVASAGRVDNTSVDDWHWIIDINLLGIVRGLNVLLPMMKRQGSGQVINIASLAAIANAPVMGSYNVTKSAVVSLSETMRHELSAYGIHTAVVCPGFFQTNLAESLRTSEPGMDQTVRKLLAGGSMNAEQVADYIYVQADKRRFLILPHKEGRLLYRIKRFVPALYNREAAKAGRRLKAKLESLRDRVAPKAPVE